MQYNYKFANWDALAFFAMKYQPASYLEVGVMSGASLGVVLEHSKPARITLCDIWNPKVYRGHPYTNHTHISNLLRDRAYAGAVTFLDGSSHDLLPTLSRADCFDLIHVDGDHSEEGAMLDLMDCWRLLNVGGHLVFDDVQRPALLAVLNHFRTLVDVEPELSLLELVKADGVAVLKKL